MLNAAMNSLDGHLIGPTADPLARLNLVLCFFGKTDVASWCDAGLSALHAWGSQSPSSAHNWVALGASASKFSAGGANAMIKCVKQIESSRKRSTSMNSAYVRGPQEHGPDYAFSWSCTDAISDTDSTETNLLEMRFPHDHLDRVEPDAFVAWARELAQSVPFDSGYAALSWSPTHESTELAAGRSLGALALRYPGFDVAISRATRFELGAKCRGAQWLVFLSQSLAAQVGGQRALAAAVPKGGVDALGQRMMIRSDKRPESGDVNRRQPAQALAPLARVLEPITFFGDYNLDILFNDQEDAREQWERRFLQN